MLELCAPQGSGAPAPLCAALRSSAPGPGVVLLVPAAICSSTTARGAAEVWRHLGGNPLVIFTGSHCKGQTSPKR